MFSILKNRRPISLLEKTISVCLSFPILLLHASFLCNVSHSQNIILDKSIGSKKILSGPDYIINQSEGLASNNKLFHSFEKLSLTNGESVLFRSNPEIDYIFTRVTGREASRINGLVATSSNKVDLFLFNPNGIIFGQNSSLDINGSFFATTADSILFSQNDVPFSVTQVNKIPSLSISVPIGIQFGKKPGPIVNRSIFKRQLLPIPGLPPTTFGLEGSTGEIIALIGGNLEIKDTSIRALGGNINLGSVGDYSIVNLKIDSSNIWSLDYSKVKNFSDINLTNTQISSTGLFNGSGSIDFQGRNISLKDKTRITAFDSDDIQSGNISVISIGKLEIINGSSLQVRAFGSTPGGNIDVVADTIKIDSIIPDNKSETGLFATTTSGSSESAGNVNVIANHISMDNEAKISVDSNGLGVSGDVVIQAEKLVLDNKASISASSSKADGGNISLKIDDFLLMQEQSFLSASAGSKEQPGDGGNIKIFASNIVSIPNSNSDIFANSFGGRGGVISITARGALLGFIETDNPNFRDNNTNDITAQSSVDPLLNGQVIFDTPEVDPSENLSEQPEAVDPPQDVAQGCRPGQAIGGSTFTHVGRGGLPPSPHETQTPATVWQDLRAHNLQTPAPSADTPSTSLVPTPPPSIVEAKGWTKDAQGRIYLTAHTPQPAQGPQQPTAASC